MNLKKVSVGSIKRKIDRDAGKTLFGNLAGLENNLKGMKLKSKSSEFEKQQFLKLGQPIKKEIIKKIKDRFELIIEDDKFSKIGSEFEGKTYMRNLKNPEKDIPEISHVLTDEIINILEEYYHGNFKVNRVESWRNYGVPEELSKNQEMFSNFWHCDNRRTDFTKLFINLSYVTEEDGPFHIVSQSRTKKLLKMGFENRKNYNLSEEILEDENYVFKGIGESGTSYLGNTEVCLHKAGTPKLGHQRDILQLRFAPSDEPIKKDWLKNIELDEIDTQKLNAQGIND